MSGCPPIEVEALNPDRRLSDLTVAELLDRLASDAPVPGGGSASALAGAMGAALVGMVVELTGGRSAATGSDDLLREIGLAAAGYRSELAELAQADAAAYAAVVTARRLPRETDLDREARSVQIVVATREATRVPIEVARRSEAVLRLAERLAPIGSRNAISDVGVAGALAVAGVRGAVANVEINLPGLPDDDALRAEARTAVDEVLDGLEEREARLRRTVGDRLA